MSCLIDWELRPGNVAKAVMPGDYTLRVASLSNYADASDKWSWQVSRSGYICFKGVSYRGLSASVTDALSSAESAYHNFLEAACVDLASAKAHSAQVNAELAAAIQPVS